MSSFQPKYEFIGQLVPMVWYNTLHLTAVRQINLHLRAAGWFACLLHGWLRDYILAEPGV